MKDFERTKKFLLSVILLTIMLLCISLSRMDLKTASVFKSSEKIEEIILDLNKDGLDDVLYIEKENDTYKVKAKIKDKIIPLIPEGDLKTFGKYSMYWPMRVSFKDVNRDNLPEVFIQSSMDKTPIQNIFQLKDGEFYSLLNKEKNILGFFHTVNNRYPKFSSGNFHDGTIDLENFILRNNKLESFEDYSEQNFMGKITISKLIQYIESLPYGSYELLYEIFSPSVMDYSIEGFEKLKWNNYTYEFQDATFEDLSYTKEGSTYEVKWTLNFKGTNSEDTSKDNKRNFTIEAILCLETTKDGTKDYRVKNFYIRNNMYTF